MPKFRTILLVTAAFAGLASMPAVAQDAAESARRLDRIERELRAVQRRVFPGGEAGLFQPEVTPGASADASPTPSGITPLGDVLSRLEAVESQLARMTEQVEQTGFRQREMETSVAQLRTRLEQLESAGATLAPEATGTPTPSPRPAPASTPAPAPRPSASTPAPAAAPANAERRARVAAVDVPSTGNAAEDAYIYGYRLWEARLYPEAQTQLQHVVETYPDHARASFAGNLMGRAYLDNNQAALAVRAFYDNFTARPRGQRAADSMYFMGMALIQLNRNPDACQTFAEFDRTYGSTASSDLKARVQTARGRANC